MAKSKTQAKGSKRAPKKPAPKRPVPGKALAKARTPAGGGRVKAPPKVTVVVDEALRRHYEALRKAFHDAQSEELGGWDAAYEALDAMLQGEAPPYLAGGFKSAKAFLADLLPGTALSTVRDNVRVARHFNAEQEKKHGVRKLALLIDYLEAESGAELPRASVDPVRTKVDVGDKRVPFATLSFDEMRDVVRQKKQRESRATKDAPAVRALRETFGGHGLGNVAVQCRAERWTLGRIEERQFADMGAALTAHAKKLAKKKPG
jgi:hypothetical protein